MNDLLITRVEVARKVWVPLWFARVDFKDTYELKYNLCQLSFLNSFLTDFKKWRGPRVRFAPGATLNEILDTSQDNSGGKECIVLCM